jgi:predicted helicase
MSSIREFLKNYRDAAETEREKGRYFEWLAVEFIKSDPGMAQEYEGAWLFLAWAEKHGLDGRDTGIDAVAKIRDEDGFCAVQCKFYREGFRQACADLDAIARHIVYPGATRFPLNAETEAILLAELMAEIASPG